jgi:adenylate cyclase
MDSSPAAGRSDPGDGARSALRTLGIAPEEIERALQRGDPQSAIFEAVLLPALADRTVSPAEIERRGGLRAAELGGLIAAFGLPASGSDEPAFTPEEADAFVELGRMRDVWPAELDVRLGRVWGPLLARMAQAAVQAFRQQAEPRLRADDPDRLASARAVQRALRRLLPLADRVLVAAHRRWIEHELAQAVVGEAEAASAEHWLPGTVTSAFLFCDLKDFTRFADEHGDAAGVEAVDQFAEVIAAQRGEDVRLMKWLGDGAMLAYAAATPAVAAGARIIDRARSETPLSAHASIHCGAAVARDGDYFGSAVNLASRLLGVAGPDELLATRPVIESTGEAYHWAAAGAREFRGFARPVEVFRLT